jgi:hypothetical protein
MNNDNSNLKKDSTIFCLSCNLMIIPVSNKKQKIIIYVIYSLILLILLPLFFTIIEFGFDIKIKETFIPFIIYSSVFMCLYFSIKRKNFCPNCKNKISKLSS